MIKEQNIKILNEGVFKWQVVKYLTFSMVLLFNCCSISPHDTDDLKVIGNNIIILLDISSLNNEERNEVPFSNLDYALRELYIQLRFGDPYKDEKYNIYVRFRSKDHNGYRQKCYHKGKIYFITSVLNQDFSDFRNAKQMDAKLGLSKKVHNIYNQVSKK